MEDLFAGLKDVVVPDDCWEPVKDGWKGDWCYFQKGHKINLGRQTSQLQKEKAKENALKRNKNYKGENNPRAKTWKVTYQDGRVEIVKALQPWRIEKGYNKLGLRKLQLGEWKRYKDLSKIEIIKVTHL